MASPMDIDTNVDELKNSDKTIAEHRATIQKGDCCRVQGCDVDSPTVDQHNRFSGYKPGQSFKEQEEAIYKLGEIYAKLG